jgi:hypothetical protein
VELVVRWSLAQNQFYGIESELMSFFWNYNRRCNLRGRLKKINFSGAGGLGVRHQLSIQKVPGSKPVGFL